MKKILLLVIISLLLLSSCNLDSSSGIFYKVTNSVPTIENSIIAPIGYHNSKAFYLTRNGIYSKAEGQDEVAVLLNSDNGNNGGRILRAAFSNFSDESSEDIAYTCAYLDNSTTIDTENVTIKHTINPSVTLTDPIETITKTGCVLSMDGTSLKAVDTNNSDLGISIPNASIPQKVLSSQSFFLIVNSSEQKAWICNSALGFAKQITYHNYIGCQTVSQYKCYLVDSDLNVYLLDSQPAVPTLTDTDVDLDTVTTTNQLASFMVDENKVVFKTDSYFDIIVKDGASYAISSNNSGFASEISDLNILAVNPIPSSQCYVAFTQSSGLYKLDLGQNTNSKF